MKKEIDILENSLLNDDYSKEEFMVSFKNVLRYGSDEEVKTALKIINELSEHNESSYFVLGAKVEANKIVVSRIYFEAIKDELNKFKDSIDDVKFIVKCYSYIYDYVLLDETNKLLKNYIDIIKKYKGSFELNTLDKLIEEYDYECYVLFNDIDNYILDDNMGEKESKYYFECLNDLEEKTVLIKKLISDDKYNEIINRINDYKKYLNQNIKEQSHIRLLWIIS